MTVQITALRKDAGLDYNLHRNAVIPALETRNRFSQWCSETKPDWIRGKLSASFQTNKWCLTVSEGLMQSYCCLHVVAGMSGLVLLNPATTCERDLTTSDWLSVQNTASVHFIAHVGSFKWSNLKQFPPICSTIWLKTAAAWWKLRGKRFGWVLLSQWPTLQKRFYFF